MFCEISLKTDAILLKCHEVRVQVAKFCKILREPSPSVCQHSPLRWRRRRPHRYHSQRLAALHALASDRVLFGVHAARFLGVRSRTGNTCILVGYHDDKVQAGACRTTVGKLADFLKESGI